MKKNYVQPNVRVCVLKSSSYLLSGSITENTDGSPTQNGGEVQSKEMFDDEDIW